MHHRTVVFGLLLVFGLALPLLGSCGGDAQVVARQVRDYIQNVGSSDGTATSALVQGAPPEPNGGPDASVDIGSGTVLTGGGQQVEVNSDVPFGTVLLAIDGAEDYYEVNLPQPTGSATILLAVSQDVPDSSFTFQFAVADTNGAVGNFVGQQVAVEEAASSDVQVTVSWSNSADINLQVTDPNGAVINNASFGDSGTNVDGGPGAPATDPGGAFKQGTVAMEDGVGTLDQDANAGCVRSETTAETITWSGSAPEGTYLVEVSLADVCGAAQASYILSISRRGQDAILESRSFDIMEGAPYQTSFVFSREGSGVPLTVCGNEVCETGETSTSCPSDCASDVAVCGDGTCSSGMGETSASCPADCQGDAHTTCGDDVCDSEMGETCSSCEADCGPCSSLCTVTGAWVGTWESSLVGADGDVNADLTQEGSSVTGTGSITVTTCPSGGEAICDGFDSQDTPVEGTVSGDSIVFDTGDMQMEGIIGEGCSAMSGTWTGGDFSGTWLMDRAATSPL